MSLKDDEIELLESSWKNVTAIQADAARLFYGRLFELAPEVRPLFQGDIELQGRKLMQVLSAAVGNLRELEELTLTVQALA